MLECHPELGRMLPDAASSPRTKWVDGDQDFLFGNAQFPQQTPAAQ